MVSIVSSHFPCLEDYLSLVLRLEFGADAVDGGLFALEGASALVRLVVMLLYLSARNLCIYCGASPPAFGADPTAAAHRAADCAEFAGSGVTPVRALISLWSKQPDAGYSKNPKKGSVSGPANGPIRGNPFLRG